MLSSLPGAGPSVLGACVLCNVLEVAWACQSVFWRVIGAPEASWNLGGLQKRTRKPPDGCWRPPPGGRRPPEGGGSTNISVWEASSRRKIKENTGFHASGKCAGANEADSGHFKAHSGWRRAAFRKLIF